MPLGSNCLMAQKMTNIWEKGWSEVGVRIATQGNQDIWYDGN